MSLIPTLAAIRFGTGLAPGIAAPRDGAEVLDRLTGPDRAARAYPQPGWAHKTAMAREWVRLRVARRRGGEAEAEEYRTHLRAMNTEYNADLARIVARGARTEDGFRERLQWFWADHFTVTDGPGFRRKTVAGFQEDAIRPHLSGRFADLLQAAVTHPAMLVYLDQTKSIGPGSRAASKGGGLNENLAREVLELHTLGVGAAYSQNDVRELAELLTGLNITREGAPTFRANRAEPGPEVVLGRTYGGDPARPEHIAQVLDDLSVHPSTARHITGKLARHFVADDPPTDLLDAMANRWIATGGDLLAVYDAMLDHPAAWSPELQKVRRPLDYIVAAARALGQAGDLPQAGNRTIRQLVSRPLQLMGQDWQHAPGPDGWPEEATAWVTPQGLSARIEWAMGVAGRIDTPPDPRAFVQTALGPLAGDRTRFAAQAAEKRAVGVGLVLASPEFQRR